MTSLHALGLWFSPDGDLCAQARNPAAPVPFMIAHRCAAAGRVCQSHEPQLHAQLPGGGDGVQWAAHHCAVHTASCGGWGGAHLRLLLRHREREGVQVGAISGSMHLSRCRSLLDWLACNEDMACVIFEGINADAQPMLNSWASVSGCAPRLTQSASGCAGMRSACVARRTAVAPSSPSPAAALSCRFAQTLLSRHMLQKCCCHVCKVTQHTCPAAPALAPHCSAAGTLDAASSCQGIDRRGWLIATVPLDFRSWRRTTTSSTGRRCCCPRAAKRSRLGTVHAWRSEIFPLCQSKRLPSSLMQRSARMMGDAAVPHTSASARCDNLCCWSTGARRQVQCAGLSRGWRPGRCLLHRMHSCARHERWSTATFLQVIVLQLVHRVSLLRRRCRGGWRNGRRWCWHLCMTSERCCLPPCAPSRRPSPSTPPPPPLSRPAVRIDAFSPTQRPPEGLALLCCATDLPILLWTLQVSYQLSGSQSQLTRHSRGPLCLCVECFLQSLPSWQAWRRIGCRTW